MARKRASSPDKGKRKPAARAEDVRKRIRDLTARALRNGKVAPSEISDLVQETLKDAANAVERAMPTSRTSVLRQVSAGLGDALHAVTQAGAQTVQRAREGGRAMAEHTAPLTAKHLRAANDEFLRAVSTFANRTSTDLAEELRSFVTRARRTGGRVRASAQQAAQAAEGRWTELTDEAVRAGMSAAHAASQFALAAKGVFEGLGEAMSPPRTSPPREQTRRPAPKGKKAKRAVKRASARKE
jgi:hypothetical protein